MHSLRVCMTDFIWVSDLTAGVWPQAAHSAVTTAAILILPYSHVHHCIVRDVPHAYLQRS